jgi:sucrose phosphorylase
MLAMQGVPGLYIHSLLGSGSYHAGVQETGRYRTVNRQKFRRNELEAEMADANSRRFWVFNVLKQILRQRRSNKAFHPNGPQQILPGSDAMFNLVRTAPGGTRKVICLHNISAQSQRCHLNLPALAIPANTSLCDVVTNTDYVADEAGHVTIDLKPYQAVWLDCGNLRPNR